MISTFQFSDPSLLKFLFEINNGFVKEGSEDINIELNTEIHIQPGPDVNSSVVILKLSIGSQDDSSPFYIYAEEGAAFRWDPEEMDEQRDKLLKQNAPALLLSYLRPTISLITSVSPFDTYNIPFINFTKK